MRRDGFLTFKQDSSETIEANAVEAGRAYAQTFRARWQTIEGNADNWKLWYADAHRFVDELLDAIEVQHRDHVTVVAQCINIQNWLAQRAGITARNDSAAD